MAYKDPADIEEQHRVEDDVEAAAIALEVAVLAVIARRLGKLQDASLVEVYAVMPSDLEEIRRLTASGTRNIKEVTKRAMDRMAAANDEWAAEYYKFTGTEQIPSTEHFQMKETLRRETKNATDAVKVNCQSSVIGIVKEDYKGKVIKYTPLEEAYKQIVTDASTKMAAGAKTNLEVIADSVRMLSESGLKVQYASGATRSLYSAVSTNVMDSYRVAMSDMREIQGKEFGADGVEVSAHALCARDHQPFQGMRYPYKHRPDYRYTWDEVQSMPDRPLVTGANCGHIVFPILIDAFNPAYSRQELNELRKKSNEQIELEGLSGKTLKMSRYEASQYQRQIETSIRKANERSYLMKQAGQDTAKLDKAIKARTSEYRRISKEAGLTTRMERTRAYVMS